MDERRTGGSFVRDPESGALSPAPGHKPLAEKERPVSGERVGGEKGAPAPESAEGAETAAGDPPPAATADDKPVKRGK